MEILKTKLEFLETLRGEKGKWKPSRGSLSPLERHK
jgi:hypothetical protein